MNQNEFTTTVALDAVSRFVVPVSAYQQIDAELARYEAEAAALKQRMDALTERREGMRQQACDQALPEIVERMTSLGITLEQVRAALAAAKPAAPVIDKYRNPETGDTHSGKGGCPGWLTPEAKKDLRYRNPVWTAKDDAKKNKNKPASTPEAVEAPASNDAPTMTDGAEHPASNANVPIAVANVAVVDMAHVATNTASASIVSNLN